MSDMERMAIDYHYTDAKRCIDRALDSDCAERYGHIRVALEQARRVCEIIEVWRVEADNLSTERDEALAEVERLRARQEKAQALILDRINSKNVTLIEILEALIDE